MITHKWQTLGIAVLVLALTASGCIFKKRPANGWKPVKPNRASLVHEVKWPGETLPMIAKWYSGDSRKWPSLAKANPTINPEKLYIGNRVFVPGEMVKRNQPLPQDFIGKFSRGKKKKRPAAGAAKNAGQSAKPPAPRTNDQEEFEMFGPK